ncbi:MAG: hypothetical protein DMG24_16575, partial [Acidobacteria bacterium]
MESVENQKAGFPLFPPPLEIRKSSGFPHFHSYYGGGGGGLEASPNPQRPKVGQIKPPKWAKRTCQTHVSGINTESLRRKRGNTSKLSWGKRAYAVFLLCATTAIALHARTFTTLHSFDGTDGANPFAGMIQATDGNFYGAAALGGANSCIILDTDVGCGTV